jgi:hypothetical protein
VTISRKLQTVHYPKEHILAVDRKDIVEVRTSRIRTIEYLSGMVCALEHVPAKYSSYRKRLSIFFKNCLLLVGDER